MPFVISHESLKSFEKDRVLSIDSFLSPASFDALKKSILDALSAGTRRDLFREHLDIKKSLLTKSTQKMACELCNERKLLFAFDQLIEGPQDVASVQELASVFPIKLAGLLCWQGEAPIPLPPIPAKPNQILFFDCEAVLPWNEIPKGQRFYLFGFAPIDAVYRENLKDPYTHLLKRLDYQNNQPLSSKTHPLIKG